MYDYLRKGELIMSKEKSLVVDNIQSLEELISSVKEAQRIFSTYSQEQVDKIFTAAALAANKEYLLPRWLLKKLVWELLKTR